MNQPYSYVRILSTGKNSAWARLELAFTGKNIDFLLLTIFSKLSLIYFNDCNYSSQPVLLRIMCYKLLYGD